MPVYASFIFDTRQINQQVKAAKFSKHRRSLRGFLPAKRVRTTLYNLVTCDLIAKQNNSFHAQGFPLNQVCKLHLVGSVCIYLDIFTQGGRVRCREKDQDPPSHLPPKPIPVSYRKCVVNQKKLLVGGRANLEGRALWEIVFFFCGNVEGIVDLFRPSPWLNDYYDSVRAFASYLWLYKSSAVKSQPLLFWDKRERDRDGVGGRIEGQKGRL